MKVGIGNDHAAVELKMQIKEFMGWIPQKAVIIRRSEKK